MKAAWPKSIQLTLAWKRSFGSRLTNSAATSTPRNTSTGPRPHPEVAVRNPIQIVKGGQQFHYGFGRPKTTAQAVSFEVRFVRLCLVALVSLALNSIDVALCAGLYISRVAFIGVDVHGEFEIRVDAHEHVAENKFAVPCDSHAHE